MSIRCARFAMLSAMVLISSIAVTGGAAAQGEAGARAASTSTTDASSATDMSWSFEGDGTGSMEGWTSGGEPEYASWVFTTDRASDGSFSLSDFSPLGPNSVNNADLWAQSPILDLTGKRKCELTYDINYEVENPFDFLTVEYSPDGASWIASRSHEYWTNGTWESYSDSIGALDGDDSAFVRFRLVTDESVSFEGVHLDDIRVECLGPPPAVSIADASLSEGDSGTADMTFDVSLSSPAEETVTVDYATSDGSATAGSDYVAAATTTLTFLTGESTKEVSVPVMGDVTDEPDETFLVDLLSPTGVILDDSAAIGTIEEDDDFVAPPTLTKPSAKYTKQRMIALRWSHDEEPATFDVTARRALYDGGFGADAIVDEAVTGDATEFKGRPGATYCFTVSASAGGSTSELSNEKCSTIPVDDRSMTASGDWAKRKGNGHFLSTYTMTKAKGETLSLAGVQGREIALVVEKCDGCGKVKVFFDGKQVDKVSLDATRTKRKKIVSVAKFDSSRRGTLKIMTTTGKRVAIDGVAVRA